MPYDFDREKPKFHAALSKLPPSWEHIAVDLGAYNIGLRGVPKSHIGTVGRISHMRNGG